MSALIKEEIVEKLKENVEIPDSLRYETGTSHEPLTFFSEALCASTTFDIILGFFSSSAIRFSAEFASSSAILPQVSLCFSTTMEG